ncbi:hypothetical protein HDV00_012296, partial [Rhizophlyctis rosea]
MTSKLKSTLRQSVGAEGARKGQDENGRAGRREERKSKGNVSWEGLESRVGGGGGGDDGGGGSSSSGGLRGRTEVQPQPGAETQSTSQQASSEVPMSFLNTASDSTIPIPQSCQPIPTLSSIALPPRAPNDTRTGLLSATRRSSSLDNIAQQATSGEPSPSLAPPAFPQSRRSSDAAPRPAIFPTSPTSSRTHPRSPTDITSPAQPNPETVQGGKASLSVPEINRPSASTSGPANFRRPSTIEIPPPKEFTTSSNDESSPDSVTLSTSDEDADGNKKKRTGGRRSVFQRLTALGGSERASDKPSGGARGDRGSGVFSSLRPGLAKSEPTLASADRRTSIESTTGNFDAGPSDTTLRGGSKESLATSPQAGVRSHWGSDPEDRRGSWSSMEPEKRRRGRSRSGHRKSGSREWGGGDGGDEKGKKSMRSRNASGRRHSIEGNRKISSARRDNAGSDGEEWNSLGRNSKRPGSGGQYTTVTAPAFLGVQDAKSINVYVDMRERRQGAHIRGETGGGYTMGGAS